MDRNRCYLLSGTPYLRVRLVRACGSKRSGGRNTANVSSGQARKSLWIETYSLETPLMAVVGQARKSLWIETTVGIGVGYICPGQARKSLWIETGELFKPPITENGQARKSLWIETAGVRVVSLN